MLLGSRCLLTWQVTRRFNLWWAYPRETLNLTLTMLRYSLVPNGPARAAFVLVPRYQIVDSTRNQNRDPYPIH